MPDDTPSTPAHSIEATKARDLAWRIFANQFTWSASPKNAVYELFVAEWEAAFDRGRTHTAQPTVNAEEEVELVGRPNLREAERRYNRARRITNDGSLLQYYAESADDVPVLLAEIRRLRAALATPPTPQSPDRGAEVTALISEVREYEDAIQGGEDHNWMRLVDLASRLVAALERGKND